MTAIRVKSNAVLTKKSTYSTRYKTYNKPRIYDINKKYVAISENYYDYLVRKSESTQFPRSTYFIGGVIVSGEEIKTFYDKIDEKYNRLDNKIDTNTKSINDSIHQESIRIQNSIEKLNNKFEGKDGVESRLTKIEAKQNFSLKSKELWIPVICSIIVALIAKFL